MSEWNGNSLAYLTKCRIKKEDGTPCAYSVTTDSVPIVGQPHAKLQRLLEELMKHALKKHPKAVQAADGMLQEFFKTWTGWFLSKQFETQDPLLLQMRREFEVQIRRTVTPHAVTDDEIEGALAQMQLTMDDPHREPFKKALQYLRDYYEGKIPQETFNSVKPLVETP